MDNDIADGVVDSQLLAGQTALITGASKGIGRGIADAFVDAGASVLLVARGAEALERAAFELGERVADGQFVEAIPGDMSDVAAIEGVFRRVDELAVPLDIAVANSGSGAVTPFIDVDLEHWRQVIDLNLTGAFFTCQLAARRMIGRDDRPNRNILVVSSVRALGALPGRAVYSITKAGVNQMARVLANELAPHRVRVNILSPGITATPLTTEANPEVFAEVAAGVPLGGAATPADMGSAALFLCSPRAAHITGTNLVVDGGEALG
jgi:NAD(P)-dependent dehydrogenase (short-subunit alcohol dehydrogenase family)